MEVITLNGREYIRASKAAREVGYTSDYVGQLCRSGAVTAERVGRNWYVDRGELREHKTEKKRNARSKAREHVKKVIKERSVSDIKPASTKKVEKEYEHRYLSHADNAQYSSDKRPLIPEIKKTAKNKDFREYIVEDLPEVSSHKDSVREVRDDNTNKIPLTIKEVHPRKAQEKKLKKQTTPRPADVLSTVKSEEAYDNYRPGSSEFEEGTSSVQGSFLSALTTVFFAVILSSILVGLSAHVTVQINDFSDARFNQFTDEYSIDFDFLLSKTGLK